MGFCRQRHDSQQDNSHHQGLEHNPLQSCYDPIDHQNPFALYDDVDESSSGDPSTDEDVPEEAEDDDCSDYGGKNSTDCQFTTSITKIQIRLNDLINRRKAPLQLYDDIVHLFNDYMSCPNFSKYAKLKTRRSFIKKMEVAHPDITALRPVNKQVTLHDNMVTTVPVFDARAMIADILTNSELMKKVNIAKGYDIFTGNVDENHSENKLYGEIHTGDEWIPARDRYCRPHDASTNDMPVGMVIFGDKSHTDLHGALALTPIIFTLTFFNRSCRNDPKFWRVLGYLPNLGYGKNKSNKTATVNKVQDEHDCLSCVFESIRRIHKKGGFRVSVLGKDVNVKIWIHFFIGDTEGNNKWLGHFSGNKSQVRRPYRDCCCTFDDLANPNPSCVYTTINEMKALKLLQRTDEENALNRFKEISRYPITNALTKKYMPLSDIHHGPYFMMPPELLHTSGSGLIKYMFQSMQNYIGETKLRNEIDKMHVRVLYDVKRQSDRDFPCGSMRNGIIDDTKCQSEERKGNLFLLLCIASTTLGGDKIQTALRYDDDTWKKWLKFVKLYLSMEEWFHDSNPKEEVDQARPLIGKVLRLLQELFPRDGVGNEWNIPKLHAATKFQPYMKRYGSAMNFYGGTGESAHKIFVKAPGEKTQRRVSEFASQVATQYYNMIITTKALGSIDTYDTSNTNSTRGNCTQTDNFDVNYGEDVRLHLSGQYSLRITDSLTEEAAGGANIYPQWKTNVKDVKTNNYKFRLHPRLVKAILKHVNDMNLRIDDRSYRIEGYT